jgi:hypothetical protein
MTDEVYCDICKDQDVLTPATIAFRVQREDDPDATPQYVRCCDEHEGQAAVAAALICSNLAPAAVYRSVLRRASTSRSVGRESRQGQWGARHDYQPVSKGRHR